MEERHQLIYNAGAAPGSDRGGV